MFVRIKTTPNSPKRYVQIVQSVRKGNKVSQKIVRHVGFALDNSELEQLKNLAESIKSKLEQENQRVLFSPEELSKVKGFVRQSQVEGEKDIKAYHVNLKDILEEDRVISGIHDIYGLLFDEMGYDKVLSGGSRQSGLVKIFKDIVLARVTCSESQKQISHGRDAGRRFWYNGAVA